MVDGHQFGRRCFVLNARTECRFIESEHGVSPHDAELQTAEKLSLLEEAWKVKRFRDRFDYDEDYDVDRLVAMIASRSQTILLPPVERDRLLDDVRTLAPPPPFSFPSVCQCWRGERLPRN